eukprot:1721501-Karenia_brevis.AAC.1
MAVRGVHAAAEQREHAEVGSGCRQKHVRAQVRQHPGSALTQKSEEPVHEMCCSTKLNCRGIGSYG